MVIIKITGGLGNQLFQYAFGQYVAKKLNLKVKYDLQTKISISTFTEREFALLYYNFDIEVAKPEDVKLLKIYSKGFCSRLKRKLVQKVPSLSKRYFVEDKLHNVIFDKELKDDCYYDGYWQSYKYLEINNEFLRNKICLKNFSIRNEKLKEKISFSNSISLHVRRGDYISIKKNSDIFHICNLNYYIAAIDLIEKKIIEPQYYIFSDDIEWAKANFVGSKFYFIEGNSPVEDMYLMSLCKHNIIANSTFSWWAAWLNNNVNKEIICPTHWYVNGDNLLKEFIPNSWIRL